MWLFDLFFKNTKDKRVLNPPQPDSSVDTIAQIEAEDLPPSITNENIDQYMMTYLALVSESKSVKDQLVSLLELNNNLLNPNFVTQGVYLDRYRNSVQAKIDQTLQVLDYEVNLEGIIKYSDLKKRLEQLIDFHEVIILKMKSETLPQYKKFFKKLHKKTSKHIKDLVKTLKAKAKPQQKIQSKKSPDKTVPVAVHLLQAQINSIDTRLSYLLDTANSTTKLSDFEDLQKEAFKLLEKKDATSEQSSQIKNLISVLSGCC